MSSPECAHGAHSAKGLPEKIAFRTILAFLIGQPVALEIAVAVGRG